MQTATPLPLKSIQIGFSVQKHAQCSETYENTIFRFLRFLVYEIWLILYSKYLENVTKNTKNRQIKFLSRKMRNVET